MKVVLYVGQLRANGNAVLLDCQPAVLGVVDLLVGKSLAIHHVELEVGVGETKDGVSLADKRPGFGEDRLDASSFNGVEIESLDGEDGSVNGNELLERSPGHGGNGDTLRVDVESRAGVSEEDGVEEKNDDQRTGRQKSDLPWRPFFLFDPTVRSRKCAGRTYFFS